MLSKQSFCHYKIIKTCCKSCRKQTNNIGSKKVIMTNKVIRQVSKCANCIAENSMFLTKRANKKSGLDKSNPTLFIYQTQVIIKHADILFELQKIKKIKIQKC